jgi:transposase-like protein
MPWEVTGPVRERTRFIETYLTGLYTITELAERFGVSRQKLHKWLARHNVDGMKGLVDRSRAPLHIPHRTSEPVAEKIIDFRRRFPHMGPRKILARLGELHPDLAGLRLARPVTSFGVRTWSSRASVARRRRTRCECAVSRRNRTI